MNEKELFERDFSDDENYSEEDTDSDDEGSVEKYSVVFDTLIKIMNDDEVNLDILGHLDHTAFIVGKNNEDILVLKISKNYWPDLHTIPREIRILHQLSDCKSIVTMHDFYVYPTSGAYAVVLDKIDEEDMEEEDKMDFVVKMFQGLKEIHDHNIIHRDISSGNVLWTKNKEVKFIDFNMSCFDDEDHEHYRSCGTGDFTANEVYEKQGYGKKIDVYAAGLVALAVLEGDIDDMTKMKETFTRTRHTEMVADFFYHVLHHNPDTRFSADEALAHQFLSQENKPIKNN